MGKWSVETGADGVLTIRLAGSFDEAEMEELMLAHNAAIDALRGATYRVFVDLRELVPLSFEAARVFERAKAYSAAKPGFLGSAVLVASSVVAMQHRRTSIATGIMDRSLISEDEAACRDYLRRLKR